MHTSYDLFFILEPVNNIKANRYFCHIIFNDSMKLEVEHNELSTIVASLGKSRHYFESVRKDPNTADWLQQIRIKLIKHEYRPH